MALVIVGAAQQQFWIDFVEIIGKPELKDDPRFKTNADRVKNNTALIAIIEKELVKKPKAHWLAERNGIECELVQVGGKPLDLGREVPKYEDHKDFGKPNPSIAIPDWVLRKKEDKKPSTKEELLKYVQIAAILWFTAPFVAVAQHFVTTWISTQATDSLTSGNFGCVFKLSTKFFIQI